MKCPSAVAAKPMRARLSAIAHGLFLTVVFRGEHIAGGFGPEDTGPAVPYNRERFMTRSSVMGWAGTIVTCS